MIRESFSEEVISEQMPGDVKQQAMKILRLTQMQRLGKVSVLHWKREKARRAGVKGARETLAGNQVVAVARARWFRALRNKNFCF